MAEQNVDKPLPPPADSSSNIETTENKELNGEQVTEDQFVQELLKEPNKDFYTLGFLLGLSEPSMKETGHMCRRKGIDVCLRDIYRRLQSCHIKLTWEKIVDALYSPPMDNKDLAQSILQKFCSSHKCPEYSMDDEFEKLLDEVCSSGKADDDAGFFFVSNILKKIREKNQAIIIDENDIRRIVAGCCHLTMDEDDPSSQAKIRISYRECWKEDGYDKTKDPSGIEVGKEDQIYYYVSTVCRFGNFRKALKFDKDGFVEVWDVLDLLLRSQKYQAQFGNIDNATIYLKRAVKYSAKDVLVFDKKMEYIRHSHLHPPAGHYKTPPDCRLWSNLRTLLCDPSDLEVDRDGYASVKDILSNEKIPRNITEKDIIRMVEDPPQGTTSPQRFELKEGPPLKIRSKWGYTSKGVSMLTDRKILSANDPEARFVVFHQSRKLWVVTKKRGIEPERSIYNEITLLYKTEKMADEQKIFEEYGHHKVTIVINMRKALEDGLEFFVLSPEKIVCKSNIIPPKYFERIL